MTTIEVVAEQYREKIYYLSSVVSYGVGVKTINGKIIHPIQKVISVGVKDESDFLNIPKTIEGYTVQVEIGEIIPY